MCLFSGDHQTWRLSLWFPFQLTPTKGTSSKKDEQHVCASRPTNQPIRSFAVARLPQARQWCRKDPGSLEKTKPPRRAKPTRFSENIGVGGRGSHKGKQKGTGRMGVFLKDPFGYLNWDWYPPTMSGVPQQNSQPLGCVLKEGPKTKQPF